MTIEELNYQSADLSRSSPMRTAAWITLLILGILYCLAGLCTGSSMIFVVSLLKSRGGMAAGADVIIYAVTAGVLLVLFGSGITYIWTCVRVRRKSRRAAVTALVVAIVNVSLIVILCGVAVVAMFIGKNSNFASAIPGLIMYGTAAAANIVAAWMLLRVLREDRAGI